MRLRPKRARQPGPAAAPPLRPIVPALLVTKDFTCEGFSFREGERLSPDSPIVEAILREHPHYLEPVF